MDLNGLRCDLNPGILLLFQHEVYRATNFLTQKDVDVFLSP